MTAQWDERRNGQDTEEWLEALARQPGAEGMRPDFDKAITANNHFDDLWNATHREFRHLFGEQSK